MHVATQAERTPLDGEYKDRGLRIGISTGSGEGSAGLEINRSPLRMSLSSIPSETLNTSVEPQRVVTPECNANRFESNPRKGMLGTGAASRAAQGPSSIETGWRLSVAPWILRQRTGCDRAQHSLLRAGRCRCRTRSRRISQ